MYTSAMFTLANLQVLRTVPERSGVRSRAPLRKQLEASNDLGRLFTLDAAQELRMTAVTD